MDLLPAKTRYMCGLATGTHARQEGEDDDSNEGDDATNAGIRISTHAPDAGSG